MFIGVKALEEIHDEMKEIRLKELRDEFEECKEKIERLEREIGCKEDKKISDDLWPYCDLPRAIFRETLQEKVDRLQTKMNALEEYFDITTEKISAHTKYKKNKKAKK